MTRKREKQQIQFDLYGKTFYKQLLYSFIYFFKLCRFGGATHILMYVS